MLESKGVAKVTSQLWLLPWTSGLHGEEALGEGTRTVGAQNSPKPSCGEATHLCANRIALHMSLNTAQVPSLPQVALFCIKHCSKCFLFNLFHPENVFEEKNTIA